jgi:hypothetical protein
VLDNGGYIQPSKYQEWLWECWEHFWKRFVPKVTKHCSYVEVVHNGDVVEGIHHDAVDMIPNKTDQRVAAIGVLKPIAAKYRLTMTRGTQAHGGQSDQDTEEIAHSLHLMEDPDTQCHSWWQYWRKLEGVVFQFAHHIGGTSSAAYETSAPMRELVAALIEASQWGQELPQVLVRSHRHRFVPVSMPSDKGRIQLIVTPGWQLRTPHVEKIDRMRLPHIGGVIFLVEDGRCQIVEKLYPMPGPKIVEK